MPTPSKILMLSQITASEFSSLKIQTSVTTKITSEAHIIKTKPATRNVPFDPV